MSVKYDFSGKKALVTGGCRGIGRQVSIALAESGARVVALHVSATPEPFDPKLNIQLVRCDLLEATRDELAAKLQPHLPFHYLVNNAGVADARPFLEQTKESIQRVLNINVVAAVLVAQVVTESMIANDIKGSIVNVTSICGLKPMQGLSPYCASKSALDGFTRCMALELGQHGIRVNSVNPTIVLGTDMAKQLFTDPAGIATADRVMARTPLGKFTEQSETVQAILWPLSDGAAMTTGHRLPNDGGYTEV